MTSWHSYPRIANLGHSMIRDLLTYEVNVEEKVDGSQFSFGVFDLGAEPIQNPAYDVGIGNPGYEPGTYELRFRSKGAMIHPEAPPAMFKPAIETVKHLHEQGLLVPGWTYRAETLCKPKHNTLVYDRVPRGNIILFDINIGEERYLGYHNKAREAERLGLEVVPLLYSGRVDNIEQFRSFLDKTSVLGGQKIEGVVVKPKHYNYFGVDKKVLMGKFVSEAFREIHSKSWRESNPTRGDVVEKLIDELSTPARYQKAVQHLREHGEITDSVKDIGKIIAEVKKDISVEAREHIMHALYRYFADTIVRRAAAGVPQWWKEELVKKQFEEAPLTEDAWHDLGRPETYVVGEISDEEIEKHVFLNSVPQAAETHMVDLDTIPDAEPRGEYRGVIPQADGDSTPIVTP